MEILHTVFYFMVVIGLLVAFHEFGHFWVARKVGVKVLRFSIGFGKVIYSYQKTPDATEYALSAIPLGGYVKMVDEREGTVKPEDLPFAFNRQSVKARATIVCAGPLFNLFLAILLYWAVFMFGETGMRPIIGVVERGTLASLAGFTEGEEIITVANTETPTWSLAMEQIVSSALDNENGIEVTVKKVSDFQDTHWLKIPAELLEKPEELYQRLGLKPWTPVIKPIIGKILDGGAAQAAGLRSGDLILSADGILMKDWVQWVNYVQQRSGKLLQLQIERDNQQIAITLTPKPVIEKEKTVGKIGAGVFIPQALLDSLNVKYKLSPFNALIAAFKKTYDYSSLTLKMMGKMLVGKSSTDNLSGPISIAQYAGQSAEMGLVPFLKFLALVSLSLGILNLLPVPVLDGGHLLFFAIEGIKGSPISEKVQLVFQNIGMTLLMGLMLLAVFLDIGRLFQ